MMQANVQRAASLAIKEKVSLMVEACKTLFTAVIAFKTGSEPRAALTHANTKKEMEGKIEELKGATVETEKLDLVNLLKLIQEIRDAQALVETLDEKVGAGAAPGIVGATTLVYTYADQLTARQTSLTSASAFAAMEPLQPEDAALLIEPQFKASLQAASEKIDQIIKEQEALSADASAKLMVLAGSTDASNATKMHTVVDAMMAANQAKAVAEQLRGAVDTAVQVVTNFFRMFGDYKAKQEVKKAVALGHVDELIEDAAAIHAATDANIISEIGTFFHLYHLMWGRQIEAEDAMPDDDEDYTTVRSSLDESAIAVHEWLNGEMQTMCVYYKTCAAARAELVAALKDTATVCDKREEKTDCLETADGHGPLGRMCKWINPSPKDDTGDCESVNPPTQDLKYGSNHADGAGIFY